MPVRSRPRAAALRALPAVEAVLRHPALEAALSAYPRPLVVEAVRGELAAARERLSGNGDLAAPAVDELAARAAASVAERARPALRRLLNATGVVLHTNLGRAPLAPLALAALAETARGYCSLELDLVTGRRGHRGLGVERWITRLTGAEAALTVNNGAAAILLALTALASGRKVIVSRGELVEIGGSFRVPDIMAKSGAELVEIGTTNRTHLVDYERALARHRDAAAVLRVHPSNFRIGGFTARPEAGELARLAHRHRVPLIEDLGSGALVDLAGLGIEHEPTAAESLRAGSDVVTFSGDKLLGGAQAGLVVGRRRWIERLRKDPLARALRLDKLALAVLEATLPLYADSARAISAIPALEMLRLGPEELGPRAERIAAALVARVSGLVARTVDGDGEVGGGALPLERLRGRVVEVRHAVLGAPELERRARNADPPVIGTVRGGAFRLDPRTLLRDEDEELINALSRAWDPSRSTDSGHPSP